jgi:phosphate transport system substrate-binding protein
MGRPGRRSFIASAGAASLALLPAVAWAQRLTPADQRIDPKPVAPESLEARLVATLPQYVPEQSVSGTISIWGHGNIKLPWMHHLVELWETGFKAFHPRIVTDYQMHGTSSGIPALFTGAGDIAILGEEILPKAAAAFEKFKGYLPHGIEIATGSFDVRNFDYAQMVFVHRDNPLARMSLAELDGILGAEHRRGDRNIRTWGALGLGGQWAKRPITPYSWAIDDSFGFFLQQFVMEGSHRWNCDLREFVHIYQPDGAIYDHGQQILDALARDCSGIAISNIRYARPDVKPLALARDAGSASVHASKASLIDGSYPLARTIPAVVDRPPGLPIEPKVREFLRYLLSRNGQEMINRDGRYLPLSPALIAEQLRNLA